MPTLAIPASARVYVYAAYSVLALVTLLIQIGYAAIEAPQPDWLVVALAVVPALGVGIGYTAATHTPTTDAAEHYDRDGDGIADQAQEG